jgi:PHD/YefM family antitoxin component YafN of YafNO toxin-antitoxin module
MIKSTVMTLNPQFVTDKKGRKTAVQLSVKEYEYLIEELEMKEDIALYEKVKADKKESYMPLKDYLKKGKKK